MVSLKHHPFPDAERAQARRLNQVLRVMPRFRRPTALSQFAIQSFTQLGQVLTPRAAGVRIQTRRLTHQGQTVDVRTLTGASPARAVYIDWHGGGWSIGNAAIDDPVNSALVKKAGLAVVSVDYGLLPKTSLAVMLAQSAAAADWVFENAAQEFGTDAVFMGGESAGAHLCACTVMKLKATRADLARLRGVVLFYGVYDLDATPSVRAAPRDALVLHGPSMRDGLGGLVEGPAEAHRRHPDVSPLYADLAGLPPALLLVGALDPLIDDTTLMAERWGRANGNAEIFFAPDAPHAFNRFPTAMAARTNAYVRTWISARATAAKLGSAAAE